MITLTWAPYPEANVASYRVYRSLIGFRAPIITPSLLAGLTLILALNGGASQTITFDGVTPIVSFINSTLTGGQAYASISQPTTFLLRSDVRESPGSVQIVGGTALSLLGLAPVTITQLSTSEQIATVVALSDPTLTVEYDDPDGALQDYYAITTVDSAGNESLKTAWQQPISSTGDLCVVEGVIADLQGVRIPDVEIKAQILNVPSSFVSGSNVTREPIVVLSGCDGRFSLPLLQGANVQLNIKATGYNRAILVPRQAFAFLTDLVGDLAYQDKLAVYV